MFRNRTLPPIVINISSLTINEGNQDMTSILEFEQAEATKLDAIAEAIAALATPAPVTVDLTPVTDALAVISTKLDAIISVVGTPA